MKTLTKWNVVLLALTFAAGVRGQAVPGMYDTMAREFPNGSCSDSECFWTLDHLLTYYGVPLDEASLRRALRDPRADVRSMAVDKLANDRGKEAIPWLAEALSTERAAGTRLSLAMALGQLGDERGVAALESLCMSGDQPDAARDVSVRYRATNNLWTLHRSASVLCSIDLLRDLDRPGAPHGFGLRAAAMSLITVLDSLSEKQISTVREISERWIFDEDAAVRRIASRAVEMYGDAGSPQKLRAALPLEKDPMVRNAMEAELKRLEARVQHAPGK